MDQIEFRPMNSSIQMNGYAEIVDPADALYNKGTGYGNGGKNERGNDRGKDKGCGGNCGKRNDRANDKDRDNGMDRGNDRDKDYGNERGNGKDRDNGSERGNGKDRGNERGNGKDYDNANRGKGCGNGCYGQTTDNGSDGHIYFRGCEEAKIKAMPDRELDNTGRVLDVTMTLRNVCPCRHVSVGYLVTEVDEKNNEHSRGFKCFTVEPHYQSGSIDMELDTMRFILPDDARVDGGKRQCEGTRHFIVRTEAHYAESGVSMT